MPPHPLSLTPALRSALFTLGTLFIVSLAHAANYTWGGGALNWTNTTAAGWNGGPPATGDTASLPGGTVEVTAPLTGTAPITIGAGGKLWLNGNNLTVANPITLQGLTSGGAIYSGDRPAGNVNTLTGQITLAATSNISCWWNDKTLHLAGKITGPGSLVLDRNGDFPVGGRFLFSSSANDYAGGTVANGRAAGGHFGYPAQARVVLGAHNALPAGSPLALNTADLFLNGFSQTLSSLTATGVSSVRGGATTTGSLTLDVASSSSFNGTLGGPGTNENNFSLAKTGAGVLSLVGSGSYTGGTTVAAGTLALTGDFSAGGGLVTVQSGATLSGTGTLGSLSVAPGASLAPGDGPGILNVAGDLTQSGTFAIEINGPAAGTQHDQVNVDRPVGDSAVSLGGTLGITFGFDYTPLNGDLFFILKNDGTDAVSGTFSGLPQGATVASTGPYDWRISYQADSTTGTFTGGNDVALQAIAVATVNQPGLTFRLFDIQEPMDRLYPLVPGQTPNVDQKRDTIDWSTTADFAGYTERFIVECSASLDIQTAGAYEFRLTSDDGSQLTLNDTLVIDHDGLHAATQKDGTITLGVGLHPLKVRFFQSGGGQALKLEWRPPGAAAFTTVPASAFLTTAGVTRVVAPGKKSIITPGDSSRPGSGQPLVAVHPSWQVTTIRPASFQPKVGALAVHPTDGRLFIATFNPNQTNTPDPLPGGDGRVYALTNTQGDNPEAVTVTEVAAGLSEPLGLVFVQGELYVSERTAILRLSDTDHDGYYETKTPVGSGWISNNYHHFHFGLIERDGYTYSTLSTAIVFSYPGYNGPNPPNRGTLVRTHLATGQVTYLAGGLRTPNGLCFGPEGEIFQTDNQGAWLPSSRLNHLQTGHFYGHYNNTADGGSPSLFADQPPSPPAVWFPQNEIANSPSQPLSIPSGPFVGDLLVGDITLGGINRVSLEKVRGVWQGCVLRFTQGLEGGVNRLAWGPNGSLYVGCVGGAGNWSWNGTTFGLQRLSPKPGQPVTFEIAKVAVTPTGFEITYTKPVPQETLETPANFTVRQWSYQATADYGGPKIGEDTLPVASATASADRLRVNLVIPGLKKGRVVYLKTDPLADDGSQILSSEAWYTLNEIPGGPFDLSLSSATVAENRPAGAAIGTLSASHDDAGEPIVYSLPAGAADNAFFTLQGDSLLTATPLDYERRSAYRVLVRATDSAGLSSEAEFTVTILDVALEHPPRRLLLTNATLPTTHPTGALVGRLLIDDADLGDLALIPPRSDGATSTVAEPFDYPPASGLSGQSGGPGFSGPWQTSSGTAPLATGSLAYTDASGFALETSGHRIIAAPSTRFQRLLATPRGTDGTRTYFSFLADPASNGYFWGLEFWNGTNSDANRVLQLGNESGFGVRVRNGTNKFFPSSDAAPHFYVIKIEHLAGNDRVSVWIDPPLAAEPATPDLSFTPTETAGAVAFDRIGFGHFIVDSAPAFDELRLGDDWNSVTPHQAAFPLFQLIAGPGDADNASFEIDGQLLRTTAPLAAGLHRLRIRATDSAGLALDQALLVWVGPGHPDSNGDGLSDAAATRLGIDPLGPAAPGAYFGSTGANPHLGPDAESESGSLILRSGTLPGHLYWIESSTDLIQWTLNPLSVISPADFLESWTEWVVPRPTLPRQFWRVGGGWPAPGQGADPLAGGLAGLNFVGGNAGWTHDAATSILRHDNASPSEWLYFTGEYSDFLLTLEFRLSPGGNSGVFLRASAEGAPWVTGSEVQLTNGLRLPIHSTGSLYDRIPAEPAADAAHSVWHRLEILMIADRVQIKVNGLITVDEPDVRLSHPQIAWPDSGLIGLQNSHTGGPGSVEFRHIRLIDLAP